MTKSIQDADRWQSLTVLALDTSTEACSVALQAGHSITVEYTEEPRRHAQALLPSVDWLLTQAGVQLAEVDCLVVTQGPGSFTGLRIAAAAAQGLAFAHGLPVILVSSLAVLAHRCWREYGHTDVLAAIDARMGEVYVGQYYCDDTGARLCAPEQVVAPNAVALTGVASCIVGAGTGWRYHQELAGRLGVSQWYEQLLPSAEDALQCARSAWLRSETVTAMDIQPVYLRDNVAQPARPA